MPPCAATNAQYKLVDLDMPATSVPPGQLWDDKVVAISQALRLMLPESSNKENICAPMTLERHDQGGMLQVAIKGINHGLYGKPVLAAIKEVFPNAGCALGRNNGNDDDDDDDDSSGV